MLTFWLEASRTRQIKAFKNLLHLNWACLDRQISIMSSVKNKREIFRPFLPTSTGFHLPATTLSSIKWANLSKHSIYIYIYIYKEFDSEFASFEVDIFQLIWFLNKISFFPNHLNHVNFNIISLNFNFKSDRAQGRE
jgi:hypothetical protein